MTEITTGGDTFQRRPEDLTQTLTTVGIFNEVLTAVGLVTDEERQGMTGGELFARKLEERWQAELTDPEKADPKKLEAIIKIASLLVPQGQEVGPIAHLHDPLPFLIKKYFQPREGLTGKEAGQAAVIMSALASIITGNAPLVMPEGGALERRMRDIRAAGKVIKEGQT